MKLASIAFRRTWAVMGLSGVGDAVYIPALLAGRLTA
jgi:hypothetical protein